MDGASDARTFTADAAITENASLLWVAFFQAALGLQGWTRATWIRARWRGLTWTGWCAEASPLSRARRSWRRSGVRGPGMVRRGSGLG